MKILLRNVSKGWFSLATHEGVRVELKVNGTAILDIPDDKIKYYNQFIPLGIAVEPLKDAIEQPVIEEQPVNHIDDMVKPEVRDDGINKIEPEHEGLSEQNLLKLTKPQLRELCDSLQIKYTSKMLKKDLIDLLLKEFPEGV